MKNLKILLFVITASLFTGCNDAIDIIQPSELSPEIAFETVDDLVLGLNGVYSNAGGENIIYFTSLFTDEVKLGISNGGQGRDGQLAFQLTPGSGDASSIWLQNYALINSANRLIAGAANITPTEAEQAKYNDIVAQARVLRAYGHLQLLTMFSVDMKDDNALGVIKLDFIPASNQQLPRNTNAEVYALINSDFDFANDNLIVYNLTNSNRTSVSVELVNALRARMALYRERYSEAAQYADPLIASRPLTIKGTNPINGPYRNMFLNLNATSQETIFKLERTIATNGNFYQYWSSVNSGVLGSPFFEVSTALFNLINTSTDVRRVVVVDPSAAPTYAVKPVGKYPTTQGIPLNGDIQVFRASELRFIKAEVLANAGDLQGAMDMVNAVRRVRNNLAATGSVGVLPTPSNVRDVWRAILDERRAELAFEGFRYVDLRRLGAKADVSVDRAREDYEFNGAYTLPIDDHRWILPIPLSEIQGNPNIQQNPGY